MRRKLCITNRNILILNDMAKRIIYKYSAIVLLIVVSTAGCDVFNSDNDDATNREPFFNFEVQDENGEIITAASSEQLNGDEIETGIGLFGEEFIAPDFIERLQEHAEFEIDPESFRQRQIFLHAEEGIGDSIRYATLNFKFLKLDEWKEGRFEVHGFSKEQRVNLLRNTFERHRRNQEAIEAFMNGEIPQDTSYVDSTNTHFSLFDLFDSFSLTEQTIIMNFAQTKSSDFPKYLLMPVDGVVDLESVTDDRIEGSFNIILGGIQTEIFLGDEFPENPDLQLFDMRGDFVTKRGNYVDLTELKAKRIKEIAGSASASTFGFIPEDLIFIF